MEPLKTTRDIPIWLGSKSRTSLLRCAGYLAYPFHYQRVNFMLETLMSSIC